SRVREVSEWPLGCRARAGDWVARRPASSVMGGGFASRFMAEPPTSMGRSLPFPGCCGCYHSEPRYFTSRNSGDATFPQDVVDYAISLLHILSPVVTGAI